MAGTVVVRRAPQSGKRGCQGAGEPRGSSERRRTDGQTDAIATPPPPTRLQPGPLCPRPGATGLEGSGVTEHMAEPHPSTTSRRRPSTENPTVLYSFLVSDTGVLSLGTRFSHPMKYPNGACVAGGCTLAGGSGVSRPLPAGLDIGS